MARQQWQGVVCDQCGKQQMLDSLNPYEPISQGWTNLYVPRQTKPGGMLAPQEVLFCSGVCVLDWIVTYVQSKQDTQEQKEPQGAQT